MILAKEAVIQAEKIRAAIAKAEAAQVAMVGRCESCKYWTQGTDKRRSRCSNDKFVYTGSGEECPSDGLGYWDYE